jgi:hypothetical protein
MTLIATSLDRNGIVLASDSNITSANNRIGREGRKTFELPHLRAGLSVAGCYTVGETPMDEWMPRFIAREETYETKSLAGFVDCLRKSLDCEMRRDQKEQATFIHIAGYACANGVFHPEVYPMSNAGDIDGQTGDYIGITDTFTANEAFWARDCRHTTNQTGFPEASFGHSWQFYADGFPHARIAYMEVLNSLNPYFTKLWSGTQLSYHPPKTIHESVIFVRMLMSIMIDLFKISDYPTLYVGGETQLIGIPFPGTR